MECFNCEGKCSVMKKFLISLFILGFTLIVICGIGLFTQKENLAKNDRYNDKVTTNFNKIYKNDIHSIRIDAMMSDVIIKNGG